MHRLSRTLARTGVFVALAVLSPLGADVASAVPVPTAAVPAAHDPTPAASPGSMPGMDDGSMPGMDDGSGATAAAEVDHGSMPGMDDGSMPGRAPGHEEAPSGSRPRGLVVGAFVLVNVLVMVSAAILRRRTPQRAGRSPRRPRPATA